MTSIDKTEDGEHKDDLFQNNFGKWCEQNGIVLYGFMPSTKSFDAEVDLNELKLAIMKFADTKAEQLASERVKERTEYADFPTDGGRRFKVGDIVLAVGNYWDEQLDEFAYIGRQTVTQIQDHGTEQQLVKVSNEKDDWISAAWFVSLATLKEASNG